MLNKERLYWTLQVGGWAAYFAMQIISIVLASGEVEIGTSRVIFFLFEALFGLLLTHFYRNYINERKWLSMSLARLIPHVFVAILIMSVAIYFLRVPVSWSLGLLVANAFDPRLMISGTLFYAFIFFLWSALHFIYNYFERYNKSLKLEASAKEIELKNLKSQLNPHFIFNALNSIRALVDENPGGAKLAINQLSALLRNSLVTEKKGLTSFEEELKLVKDYLGLESIRFEERLQTEFEVDPESRDFLVPPLMIQTLVENGIKHGISKLTEGGVVQIRTKVDGDHLTIQIRNSGKLGMNGHATDTGGLGLDNTRQRLKLIYGDDASFRILAENDNFVLTEIIIPHLYN
jgi:two-component system, LytTR family, sensor kinase